MNVVLVECNDEKLEELGCKAINKGGDKCDRTRLTGRGREGHGIRNCGGRTIDTASDHILLFDR